MPGSAQRAPGRVGPGEPDRGSPRAAQAAIEPGIEIAGQLTSRGTSCRRQRANDQSAARRQLAEPRRGQMTELAAYPVADHGPSDSATNHEPGPSRHGSTRLDRRRRFSRYRSSKVDDEPLPGGTSAQPDGGVEVRALPQSERGRKHGSSGFRATSGRQALTALSATSGKNRTAGPGAHAQPETVGLRTAAVVRLERALAHSGAPRKESVQQVNGPERCTNREMGSSRSQFHQVRGIPYGTGRRATRSNRTLRRAPVEAPALSRFSPRVSMHVDNALNHRPTRC